MTRIPVCLFAKPPVPGRVKTRLAATVGQVEAAELAAALLRDAWDVVTACPWARPVLATTDVGGHDDLGPVEAWDQGDGDLGARVARILSRAVAEGGEAFAVGADTAGLSVDGLTAARRVLQTHPAVLGASDDGGFWLLGVRVVPQGLLAGLPWSQPTTCAATSVRLTERLGGVGFTTPGWDVDRPQDLQRLVDEADAGILPEGRAVRWARAAVSRR